MSLVDTNNDGQLQATELRQTVQTGVQGLYAAADTNRDGQLTPTELNAAIAGMIQAGPRPPSRRPTTTATASSARRSSTRRSSSRPAPSSGSSTPTATTRSPSRKPRTRSGVSQPDPDAQRARAAQLAEQPDRNATQPGGAPVDRLAPDPDRTRERRRSLVAGTPGSPRRPGPASVSGDGEMTDRVASANEIDRRPTPATRRPVTSRGRRRPARSLVCGGRTGPPRPGWRRARPSGPGRPRPDREDDSPLATAPRRHRPSRRTGRGPRRRAPGPSRPAKPGRRAMSGGR